MARQPDFLDLLWEIGQGAGQGAASNAPGVWDFISNPNSLGRKKLRAEQEGRQLMPGGLPAWAAVEGTGPAGNQVGVDYNLNEPGLQGNPNIWSSEHTTPPTRARDAALEEMAQQYDPNYWDRKENEAIRAATLADADRTDGTVRVTSDMEGYEDRADIQAWLAAASPEIKEKFLADRARKAEAGLLQENPNLAAENYSPTGAPGFGGDDINWIEALYGDRPAQENAAENYSPLGGPLGEDVDWLGTGEQAAAEEVANQFAQQRQRQVIDNFLKATRDYQ